MELSILESNATEESAATLTALSCLWLATLPAELLLESATFLRSALDLLLLAPLMLSTLLTLHVDPTLESVTFN